MYKKFFSAALLSTFLAGSLVAAENAFLGVVNFTTCITDSKHGKKEQENMEALRKQMSSLIENTEKELREMAAKFEDTEYLDGLSPNAEEALKTKFQALQEDLGRYQNQFYQVLNHANYQMVQKMSNTIASASEKVAKSNKLDYVINKEACFYIRPDLDVTAQVIKEMNERYELEVKTNKKLSENGELEMNANDEMTENQAG